VYFADSKTKKWADQKTQSLKATLAQVTQEHSDKWEEIINSPNKKAIIREIEQAQKEKLAKEAPEQEKTHELEPEHI